MTTNDTNKTDSQTPTQTLPHPLAGIGAGELAYIRPVLAGEIADTVPQAKELPPGCSFSRCTGPPVTRSC